MSTLLSSSSLTVQSSPSAHGWITYNLISCWACCAAGPHAVATVHKHDWQHQHQCSIQYHLALQHEPFCLLISQQWSAVYRLLDCRPWFYQSGPQTAGAAAGCALVHACHSHGGTDTKVRLTSFALVFVLCSTFLLCPSLPVVPNFIAMSHASVACNLKSTSLSTL